MLMVKLWGLRNSDLTVKTSYVSSMATKSVFKISSCGPSKLPLPSQPGLPPRFNFSSRLYLLRLPVNFSRPDRKPPFIKGRDCVIYFFVSHHEISECGVVISSIEICGSYNLRCELSERVRLCSFQTLWSQLLKYSTPPKPVQMIYP